MGGGGSRKAFTITAQKAQAFLLGKIKGKTIYSKTV